MYALGVQSDDLPLFDFLTVTPFGLLGGPSVHQGMYLHRSLLRNLEKRRYLQIAGHSPVIFVATSSVANQEVSVESNLLKLRDVNVRLEGRSES